MMMGGRVVDVAVDVAVEVAVDVAVGKGNGHTVVLVADGVVVG